MKVLFICSGNISYADVSPFIKAQAESLKALMHEVEFFPIKGNGIFGYFRNICPLRRCIRNGRYDILHAHYSLSGIVTWLAALGVKYDSEKGQSSGVKTPIVTRKPFTIVSLLGSDVNGKRISRIYIRIVSCIWHAIIVKSWEMKNLLGLKRSLVIPNGVNLEDFKPLEQVSCRSELGLDQRKVYLLFAADPKREVKNFPLAKAAYTRLISHNPKLAAPHCQLITLGSTTHDLIPKFLNACDVLVLTSLWEGSPNIVKEAMACCARIVCTEVGDVRWLLEGLEGCFIATHDPEDIASKLDLALRYEDKTRGRERLLELDLDSESVAKRIVALYEDVLLKWGGKSE